MKTYAQFLMTEASASDVRAVATAAIKAGKDPKEAYESCIGTYGRYEGAAKHIDPRKE